MNEFIYALFDSRNPQKVAYIGKTREPGKRFVTHSHREDRATKLWVQSVREAKATIRMLILEIVSTKAADHREQEWIAFMCPPLNRTYTDTLLIPAIPPSLRPPAPRTEIDGPPFFSLSGAVRWLGLGRSAIKSAFRSGKPVFSKRQNQKFATLRDPSLWSNYAEMRDWIDALRSPDTINPKL